MTNLDALEWHVMDALADDWESIVQIRPHVAELCGSTPDQVVLDILRTLHSRALVHLMDAEGYAKEEFPVDAHDYWFAMTQSGRSLWDAEGYKYRGTK